MNWNTSSKKRLKSSSGLGKGRANRLNAHYKLDNAPMVVQPKSQNPISSPMIRPIPQRCQQNITAGKSLDVMKLNRRFLDTGQDFPANSVKDANDSLLETLQFSPSKEKAKDTLDITTDVEIEFFK
jgi:hypothetical protein